MSIHGANLVWIDNAGTPEKWGSNGNGHGGVTPYDASGNAITTGNPLIVAPDYLSERGASGTPDPGDWETEDANAPVAGDYDIRDTNQHDIAIPMLIAGWTHVQFGIQWTSYDQSCSLLVRHSGGTSANKSNGPFGEVIDITLPASTARGIFTTGAPGQGGDAGGATMSARDVYDVPALAAPMNYLHLIFECSVTPTAGSMIITVNRWR